MSEMNTQLFTENNFTELKKAFALFDREGRGTISTEQLGSLMQSLGQNPTDEELQQIIRAVDRDRNGTIEFSEFCSMMKPKELAVEKNELLRAFQMFDSNGDGYISPQEMRTALAQLGETLSEAEIDAMIQAVDTDGNGKLDYREFVAAMMGKGKAGASSQPNTIGREQAIAFVKQLQQKAIAHQAANHSYFQHLIKGDLPDVLGAIKDFATQYYGYSRNFKALLELANSHLNERQQLVLAENINEESGQLTAQEEAMLQQLNIAPDWVQGVSHPQLFRRFQQAIGVQLSQGDNFAGAVLEFNQRIKLICSQSAATAIGAIGLGIEAIVKQIYKQIIVALVKHTALTPKEYVFFTLHTEMDEEHAKQLMLLAAEFAQTASGQAELTRGMEMALSARNLLWDALLQRALAMPSPQPTTDKSSNGSYTAKLYDAQSSNWVRKQPSSLSDFTARPRVFELCEPIKEAKILDLGCGEGYCARELIRRGASQVVGVDVSEQMIAAAQAQEQQQPQGISYFQGNATKISELLNRHHVLEDTAGGYFDLVVAVFLFNYLTVEEMTRCLTEVQKLLRPGGKFIFSVPHPSFAFWQRQAAPPFYFQRQISNATGAAPLGYFTARDRLLSGGISRSDGTKLNVLMRHKTLQDYLNALKTSGFDLIPQIEELCVTDELLEQNPTWVGTLYDVPLHLAFSVEKPALKTSSQNQEQSLIKDIVWSRLFTEADYCFQIPPAVIQEFLQARDLLQSRQINWQNYQSGDAGELPNLQSFARQMRDRLYDETGFVLLQGLKLAQFGQYYRDMEETAKLFYYIMSTEMGIVSERRGRLYDVTDRKLDVGDDNVLFSATKEASGWHTDSTDKDFNPDIVGLMCLQDGAEGGILQVTNALNVYYRLRQILPQSIFAELEKPIIRDLIETGLGKTSGDVWERLRRNTAINLQRQRIRLNCFPIFGRDPYTNEFSFRYMRYWIESGHQRSEIPLSPMLTIAMNALDEVFSQDQTIYRIERKLKPGEIIYTNNHICAHNRTAFTDNPHRPARHMVRVWIDFNPYWNSNS